MAKYNVDEAIAKLGYWGTSFQPSEVKQMKLTFGLENDCSQNDLNMAILNKLGISPSVRVKLTEAEKGEKAILRIAENFGRSPEEIRQVLAQLNLKNE